MTRKTLFEGKFMRLVTEDSWEYAERVNCTGVVFIIALTEDQKMIFCEQFRVPVNRRVMELPAGLVNDGATDVHESPEDAARRELIEETGFEAQGMKQVATGPFARGSSSVLASFFRATGLKKVGPGGGDETEEIEVHEVPLGQVDSWLQDAEKRGCYIDPKIYVGLYILKKAKL